jgi:hypothetical protein
MSERSEHAGMAALSICESLLLALNDHKVLPEREIIGVLQDAAAAHKNSAELGINRESHLGAARLIKNIIAGGNSVRRS